MVEQRGVQFSISKVSKLSLHVVDVHVSLCVLRVRICEQIDHHSLFVFMWALGQPFSGAWDYVLRKVQGQVLSASGGWIAGSGWQGMVMHTLTYLLMAALACHLL
jgi:hypothetical protein